MRTAVWWRIAWRNLWRNKRRTLITSVALAFGFLAAVLMVGLSDGLTSEMVDSGTRVLSGQIQIHAADYLPERALYSTIGGDSGIDVGALLRRVAETPGVLAAAPRVYGGGLVSAADQTQGTVLIGVDVTRDPGVVNIFAAISAGRAPHAGAREVVLGSELARRLHVQPGSQVVIVAPAVDGSMGNDLFEVSGIVYTGSTGIDATTALLPIGPLRTLLALDSTRVHEIVAAVAVPASATVIAGQLRASLRDMPATEVQDWTQFRPELAEYVQLAAATNFITVVIVFAMAVFGVANTMLMGTYERRREFAVVRALGAVPGGIVRTVVFESLCLGSLALLGGVLLTIPVLVLLHRHPLDLSRVAGNFSMAGALVRPVLRVDYSLAAPVESAVALLLTALVAAIYPAFRAARVPPADALAGR